MGLLEAETEALRGKLPLRCEALEEARRNGEAAAPAPGREFLGLGSLPGSYLAKRMDFYFSQVPSLFPWLFGGLIWFDMV